MDASTGLTPPRFGRRHHACLLCVHPACPV